MTSPPSSAPVSNTLLPTPDFPLCEVCGADEVILNPEFIFLQVAGNTMSCGYVEELGLLGFLHPNSCVSIAEDLATFGCLCGLVDFVDDDSLDDVIILEEDSESP